MGNLSYYDVCDIAQANGFRIRWEDRVAQNTGRWMQVAYVNGELFAKGYSDRFRLCNDFRTLAPNNGEGTV